MDRPPRIFFQDSNKHDDLIEVNDEQVIHIRSALRLNTNDLVIAFNGFGDTYETIIQEITKRNVTLKIKNSIETHKDSIQIVLIQSIPKAKKLDDIIDELTQIGITRIIPLETRYSLLKAQDINKRLDRLKTISIEALKQSGRDFIMQIDEASNKLEVLNEFKDFDLKLIATTKEKDNNIKRIIEATPNAKKIVYFIGPEGDFSDEEVEFAKKVGFQSVSFGTNILRTESAAIYLGSILNFYYKY